MTVDDTGNTGVAQQGTTRIEATSHPRVCWCAKGLREQGNRRKIEKQV
jgi:hypothetical protein